MDDPKVRKPDISRVKKMLGWKPEVGFGEGLVRTVKYFEKGYIG